MRVHLRWEAYNLDALDTALADIAAGRVHLLAFNDHTPSILKKLAGPGGGREIQRPRRHEAGRFRALAERIGARAPAVPAGAGAARRGGARRPACRWQATTMRRSDTRQAFRARGARICEFPMAEEVGAGGPRRRRLGGDGLPERGARRLASRLGIGGAAGRGGHLQRAVVGLFLSGNAACGASILAGRGVLDLPRAWALISANPAAAAGLADRGAIAEGLRADLVLVDPAVPRVVATIAGGRIALSDRRGCRETFVGNVALSFSVSVGQAMSRLSV